MASNANVEQIATEMLKPTQYVVRNYRDTELEGVEFTIYLDVFNDNTVHITADENEYGFIFSNGETTFSDKASADSFKERFGNSNNTVTLNWLNDEKESLLLTLTGRDENNESFVYTYELHDNVFPTREPTDVNLSSILDALKTDDLAEMKQSFANLANEFNSFRGIYIGRN